MKLHRVAMLELRPAPPTLRRWTAETISGATVSVVNFDGAADVTGTSEVPRGLSIAWGRPVERAPARVCLVASIRLESLGPVAAGESFALPDEQLAKAALGLSEAVNILAVACQAQPEVFSPRPYLYLEAETEGEANWLEQAGRVTLPPLGGGGARVAPGGGRDVNFGSLLGDRPQGVALLAAGLAAGHGIGKLHELMRVFENAFALGGARLIDPLSEFLRTHQWKIGYTRGEVRAWIQDLRDPATHADLQRSKSFLLDPDVEKHLPRIEQAAYDVLFNKKYWHRSDAARLDRWAFASMIRRDGSTIGSEGAVLQMHDEWDHYGSFRLNENYRLRLNGSSENWRAVDWYFPDDAESDPPTTE